MSPSRHLLSTLCLLSTVNACTLAPDSGTAADEASHDGADALRDEPTVIDEGIEIAPPAAEEVGEVTQLITGTSKFVPGADMFKFSNNFVNQVGLADITTRGLCGGMSYAALDFYHSNITPPGQNYQPADGSPLRTFLGDRQKQSLTSNLDKWAELEINPFGWRTAEFWNWGIQKTGRVAEIRKYIDAGKPAPIDLFGRNPVTGGCGDCSIHHQVLVVGYDTGAYSSANGGGYPNLKLFVADPNHPGKTMTLRPDAKTYRYYYEGSTSYSWVTYFVDANYRTVKPPAMPNVTKGMLVTITTGANDLGGGSNNFNLNFTLKNGTKLSFTNLNRSHRWLDLTTNAVAVQFPTSAKPEDVASVQVAMVGTDTWQVSRVQIHNITNVVRGGSRLDYQAAVTFSPAAKSKTFRLP